MKPKYASKWIMALSATALLAACGDGGSDTGTDETDSTETTDETATSDFDTSNTMNVVVREDGSGTRDAFNEITGVLSEDGNTDNTYQAATIQNGTNGVITTVSGDTNGIGYISIGSMSDQVKGVNVDGAAPTDEEIVDGNYAISRPFNMAYGEDLSPVAQEFWDFIFSAEGQDVVEESGYIKVDQEAPAYEEAEGIEGTISLAGSTSVSPVAEALSESFTAMYPDVSFDISATGSSAGVTAAQDGTADIGMASREITDEEGATISHEAIALDGIAVIVNTENPLEDLTLDQVQQIFTGEVTTWEDVMN
ncbi:substrate-binding domain-containing protein [Marinilactibacillus sp. Marseille-P9653]|uniref:substrate-binding domain-containing protein n=1 Tax=Marinilactibacillus sp. Marseille-P9653 TaxID=2866583 RepID=UPI001CE3E620|nr:substrate-binding domain-containing protein [Marinilactibacillus sp. Marseille-P9653]